MADFKEFKETTVYSGVGTAFCVKMPSETKYHIVTAVPSMPSFAGEPNTIDYSTTTNKAITNIPAKNTTNNVEINMPYNLDNINICKKLKGEKCSYAYIDLNNFSGSTFSGTATYRIADIGTDSAKEIILTIVVSAWDDEIAYDMYSLFMDTVTFNDNIPEVVHLDSSASAENKKIEIKIVTDPSSATPTVTSDTQGVATATYASGNLTITAVAKGSSLVRLSVESTDDYAGNERLIKVIVD